jgi:hypothetical protein
LRPVAVNAVETEKWKGTKFNSLRRERAAHDGLVRHQCAAECRSEQNAHIQSHRNASQKSQSNQPFLQLEVMIVPKSAGGAMRAFDEKVEKKEMETQTSSSFYQYCNQE